MGRLEEARAVIPEILAINSDLTAELLAARDPFPLSEDEIPTAIASLRRAGLR